MLSPIIIKSKIETDKVIKIAPFRKNVRKTTPHKHNNYFEIIYLSQGAGHHYIDFGKYKVTPPVMFFVREEQIHYWELETEPEGYVVIIKKEFVGKSLDGELKSLLIQVSTLACLQLNDIRTIDKLLQLLSEESTNDDENTFYIIEGLLKSLLAKILQVSDPIHHKTEIKFDLYHSFIEMLSNEGGIKNKVAFYAGKLNTSPQNLNAVCRKAVNQTAARVLSGFVLAEAKRLLLYTDNTISEISFLLNFSDPSHFGKYFKKNAGSTPQSFRSKN